MTTICKYAYRLPIGNEHMHKTSTEYIYIHIYITYIYILYIHIVCTYAYIHIYIYIYIYIIQQLSLKYVVFESTLLNFTQTLTKLDLPTLRKGSIGERTQQNQKKNLTLAGSRTQVPAFLVPLQ